MNYNQSVAFNQQVQFLVDSLPGEACYRTLQQALEQCRQIQLGLVRRQQIILSHMRQIPSVPLRPVRQDEPVKTCELCQTERPVEEVCSLGCTQCKCPDLCYDCRRRLYMTKGQCPYCKASLPLVAYGSSAAS